MPSLQTLILTCHLLHSSHDLAVVEYRDVRLDASVNGIIISGVPLHYAFETVDKRQAHIRWLADTTIPVLGVCLGHQSIGSFFGVHIIRDREAEKGLRSMQILRDDPIFQNMSDGFAAITLHRASIPVPDDFVSLARSEQCANQIMRHRQRPIYGMQFHPELSPASEKLIGNFRAKPPQINRVTAMP